MKKSGGCPKCESRNVLRDAKAIDHYDYGVQQEMKVGIDSNPAAWLFKGQASCTVSAWVCGDCGFVEFYADDPKKLVDAAEAARRQNF